MLHDDDAQWAAHGCSCISKTGVKVIVTKLMPRINYQKTVELTSEVVVHPQIPKAVEKQYGVTPLVLQHCVPHKIYP